MAGCREEKKNRSESIAPVDIWRRATDNAIVQAVQPLAAKVCIEAYPNFKQLALSKDGASHFLYLLSSAYYDLAKGNGQCYCSSGSTIGRQSMY
jgi:hypothetical protein